MPRSFLFLRHGETDWNAAGRLQGSTDIPLNARGMEQARLAAQRLLYCGIDKIVCSDLARARQTAETVSSILSKPLHVDARLRERFFGAIEGLTDAQINDPSFSHLFVEGLIQHNGLRFPKNAETFEAMDARVWNAVTENLNIFSGSNVLFVSHGGVFHALYRLFLTNVEVACDNATPYRFNYELHNWSVEKLSV